MILAIRTTTGRENAVIDSLMSRIKAKQIPIKSLIQTEELRGYIFVEADEIESLQDAIRGVPHVRGILGKEVSPEELERFLIPEKQIVKIEMGDIVEIISGPFKGEKAKVTRCDEVKSEVTVELLEAAIPIPVTIPVTATRLHEKKKE
jgi:transcriptional antiterminator NusG